MSKEALMEQMEYLKNQYDSEVTNLESNNKLNNANGMPPRLLKSAKNRKKIQQKSPENIETLDLNSSSDNNNNDPQQRLQKLEQMMVGGELSNNEELKKRRNKKKKDAEERKRLLAESLRNGNDDEFMLRVYDNVQEEVKYKTRLLEKEKDRVLFLENEVKDLQREFELEREEYLDTIRKQEKQIKLLLKLNQKIETFVPHDCNYYNLDKIQTISIWNEEIQDWLVPELKREKLSLPSMNNININNNNGVRGGDDSGDYYDPNSGSIYEENGSVPYANDSSSALLKNRRNKSFNNNSVNNDEIFDSYSGNRLNGSNNISINKMEPEVDRLRMKLEQSQFNGNNYFKNRRQSELLSQTQELKNNSRLSPLTQSNRTGGTINWKPFS
jgi:hypothetical protein